MATNVHLQRRRSIRFEFTRFDTTYLIIRGWDLEPDEHALEVPKFEQDWLADKWIEDLLGSASVSMLIDAVRELDGSSPWGFRPPDEEDLCITLRNRIHRAFEQGSLTIIAFPTPGVAEQRAAAAAAEALHAKQMAERARRAARRPPPPPPEEPTHRYLVRVIDDRGAPVAGAQLRFEIEGTPFLRSTGPNGTCPPVEWFSSTPAVLTLRELPSLRSALEPRWAAPSSKDLAVANAVTVVLHDDPAAPRIPADRQVTVVLARPAVAWFEVDVVDELGSPISDVTLALVHGSEREQQMTAATGRARFDPVRAETATVEIADIDALRDKVRPLWDTIRSGELVVEAPGTTILGLTEPMPAVEIRARTRHKLSIQPWVVRARLTGLYFDTAKSFLLPSGIDTMRQLAALAAEHPSSAMLIVGHADSAGRDAYNEKLSLERASAMAAHLTNDVNAWYAWYSEAKPSEKRWGRHEDDQNGERPSRFVRTQTVRGRADLVSQETWPSRSPGDAAQIAHRRVHAPARHVTARRDAAPHPRLWRSFPGRGHSRRHPRPAEPLRRSLLLRCQARHPAARTVADIEGRIRAVSGDRMVGPAASQERGLRWRLESESAQSHMRKAGPMQKVRFVGLDVHKESITIAVADSDGGPAQQLATVPNDTRLLLKQLRRLGPLDSVRTCYEAGPTGFGLCRALIKEGVACIVVAPSLIPTKAGDRVKTDRRDAEKLARFHRSGELTAIHVPEPATEAMRDLERARDAAKRAERTARHQTRVSPFRRQWFPGRARIFLNARPV